MDQDLTDRAVDQDHESARERLGIGMALFIHHFE
jgi:hypothetical protein